MQQLGASQALYMRGWGLWIILELVEKAQRQCQQPLTRSLLPPPIILPFLLAQPPPAAHHRALETKTRSWSSTQAPCIFPPLSLCPRSFVCPWGPSVTSSAPFSTWQTTFQDLFKCHFFRSCPGFPRAQFITLSFEYPGHYIHSSSGVLITLQCNYLWTGNTFHLSSLLQGFVQYLAHKNKKNIQEIFAQEEILASVDCR